MPYGEIAAFPTAEASTRDGSHTNGERPDLRRREARVERNEHGSDPTDGMDKNGKVRAVAHQQGDALIFAHTKREQSTAGLIDTLI